MSVGFLSRRSEDDIDVVKHFYLKGNRFFKDKGSLLIENHLLLTVEHAKEVLAFLFKNGYIVIEMTLTYISTIDGEYRAEEYMTYEEDFDYSGPEYYPSRLDLENGLKEGIPTRNYATVYVEIIAGVVEIPNWKL